MAEKVETPKMNVEMLRRIRDWIASGEERHGAARFAMDNFFKENSECGTAFCIAGAAIQFDHFDKSGQTCLSPVFVEDTIEPLEESVEEIAGKILGLSPRQAKELFFAYSFPGSYYAITSAQAIKMLDSLIANGVAEWRQTLANSQSEDPRL